MKTSDLENWELENGESLFTDGPFYYLSAKHPILLEDLFKELKLITKDGIYPDDTWEAMEYDIFTDYMEVNGWEKVLFPAIIKVVKKRGLEKELKKLF